MGNTFSRRFSVHFTSFRERGSIPTVGSSAAGWRSVHHGATKRQLLFIPPESRLPGRWRRVSGFPKEAGSAFRCRRGSIIGGGEKIKILFRVRSDTAKFSARSRFWVGSISCAAGSLHRLPRCRHSGHRAWQDVEQRICRPVRAHDGDDFPVGKRERDAFQRLMTAETAADVFAVTILFFLQNMSAGMPALR